MTVNETPPNREEESQNPYEVELPQALIESFARFLVPEIRKFYESEQGQREFEEWQDWKD